MGPGPAVDAFLEEAPRSQLVIGPDGLVEPGKYDRVAVTVRDRGELRAMRVPRGVRTAALAIWLDEGTSALSMTPRPEWPELQLIRSRAVDGGWLTVLRFAAAVPVHRVVEELGRQAVWPDHAGQRGVVIGFEATDKVPADAVIADWYESWDDDSSPTGREPLHVTDPDPVMELGRLDERVLNPAGFDPRRRRARSWTCPSSTGAAGRPRHWSAGCGRSSACARRCRRPRRCWPPG